jgi:DHA2 family methylenomycin A resistance protein-like MFS transporter
VQADISVIAGVPIRSRDPGESVQFDRKIRTQYRRNADGENRRAPMEPCDHAWDTTRMKSHAQAARGVSSAPHRSATRNKALTLFAMSLGFGVVQLDVTIVNTALQAIGASLGGGVATLQWVVNTYTIAFAALILTAGTLGDRLGAKKVFLAGFAIFTLASAGCALAPNPAILIAARAVQGLGAAALVPNSLALLNHAYPKEHERHRAVGIWAAGASLALTAGPLAGGALIALLGWRTIFLVNVPIGLAGLWLTWRNVTETPRIAHRELDLRGQLLAIGALAMLSAALIESGAVGWSNHWVQTGVAASVLLLIGFIINEQHTRQPMLPLRFFSNRLFTLCALDGLLANIGFYGLIFMLSLYFQQIVHWSALLTGLAFLPMLGLVLPANLFAARVTARVGAPTTVATGAAIAAAGCIELIGIEPDTHYAVIGIGMIALGGGLGLLVPALTSALLGSVDASRSGIAAGVLNATRQTGSVLGVALFGSLIAERTRFIAGARIALMISAALFLLAACITVIGARHIRSARAS